MIKSDDFQYWNSRYESGNTGWDIGYVSLPLKEYIDQLPDKTIKILIPGAGNAYEAEYLHNRGFTDVTVLDISIKAIEQFKRRVTDFPSEKLLNMDFFGLNDTFDLILEQTFFCALPKTFRFQYAEKMSKLLNHRGKLVGVLFNIPLFEDHPPFGGNIFEYEQYFKPFFEFVTFEACYNSIPERGGNEVFMNLKALKYPQ